MPVTVDHEPLAVEKMGLVTVGQVLAHLQKDNRLVVHVLIDGQEPDLGRLAAAKRTPINGHTLYIETANPKALALTVLSEVETQLKSAEVLKTDAVSLLQKGQTAAALEKLSGCFSSWQNAQQSVVKTAELLRIDTSRIVVEGEALSDLLLRFVSQLKQIKDSLEQRDYVGLTDILTYEATRTCAQWGLALQSMRALVGSLH